MDPGKTDSWKWLLNNNGKFATKSLSDVITTKMLGAGVNMEETVRNHLVPKKVEVFVWRAKRKRLPVLSELDKRGIDLPSVLCPICEGDIESVEHSLFSCLVACDIWNKVLNWWGLSGSPLSSLADAFSASPSIQLSSSGAKIWQAVAWSCGYLIWKNRNEKIFNNKCWNPPVALSEIQVKSYEWIAKRCKTNIIDWHNWLHNPISLLV
ncbi:uncharacterized protein [Rutidosis leptorrhynchoides]|uniref:uncharacterized protein n=1 Tax=Rutidosis leptorrhynchoides TaxID=125765 RepID=UPI003A99D704